MEISKNRIENAARSILRAGGAHSITSDENWPSLVLHHWEMCALNPHYQEGSSSSVVEAFRAAKAALTSEFGDEEQPRYTTRRLRDEIRKAEERGRMQAPGTAKSCENGAGAYKWPPLKKALWDVITSAEVNGKKYIVARDLTDKLFEAILSAAKPVAWYWEDATGCLHITLDRADVVEMAKTVGCTPKPLFAGLGEISRFFHQTVPSVAVEALNVDEIAQSIVRAACELEEIPDFDADDTVLISSQDLEAVCNRHITAAIEASALSAQVYDEPEGWIRHSEWYTCYPYSVEHASDGWHLRNSERKGKYREIGIYATAIEAMQALPSTQEGTANA